jgi:hypothetical protein
VGLITYLSLSSFFPSLLQEQEVKLKKSAHDLRTSIQQNWTGTKDELKNEMAVLRNELRQFRDVWEGKSHEFVRDTFGTDVVNKIFRGKRNHGASSSSMSPRLNTEGRSVSRQSSSSDEGSFRMPSPDSRDISDSEQHGHSIISN